MHFFCFHSIIYISYLQHTWAYFTKWNAYFSVDIQSNCYVFYQQELPFHPFDRWGGCFIWWVQILGWLWEALETLIFPQMAQDQNATQTTSTKMALFLVCWSSWHCVAAAFEEEMQRWTNHKKPKTTTSPSRPAHPNAICKCQGYVHMSYKNLGGLGTCSMKIYQYEIHNFHPWFLHIYKHNWIFVLKN